MRRLICRIFGHHWHCLGISNMGENNVFLWECARCGDHRWREMWRER